MLRGAARGSRSLWLLLPVVLSCGGRANTTSAGADAAPSEAGADAPTVDDAVASVNAADASDSADASADAADAAGDASVEAGPDAPSDAQRIDAADDAPADAASDHHAAFVWPTCSAAPDGGDAGPGDGAAGDGAGVDAASGRVLEQVFAGATWSVGQSVAGMAVDAQGRVYLADANNVYVYVCGQLLIYMTAAEAAAIAGGSSAAGIQDMDMAPDGSLYILLWQGIVHSTAPHSGELFQSTSSLTFPHRLGAIANDRVAVTHRGGLTEYASTGGTLVYSASQIGSPSDCAVEDLTTDPSGVFLYNVGCNGSPLLRGNVDGSGIWVLSTTSALNAFNFICSARDPAGGFYSVITDQSDQPHLYHVDETATGTQAFTEVTTRPSLIQAEASQSETFAFMYCSLATAPDGTVFFQTMSQLWKVAP